MKDKIDTEIVAGIEYIKPRVFKFQDTGIGVPEFAARTCYDSFHLSENDSVKELNNIMKNCNPTDLSLSASNAIKKIHDIEKSDLLDDLAWTYFHHSILEHAVLSYYITDIGRGVLQELARHRIASYSVRSTRYTMTDVIYAFFASYSSDDNTWKNNFILLMRELDLFIFVDIIMIDIEIEAIYKKLSFQLNNVGGIKTFSKLLLAKNNLNFFIDSLNQEIDIFEKVKIFKSNKAKKNSGDVVKHIVTDNWKVDLMLTINIRSLKNLLNLRDSGAAWFQARWLAKSIKKATPKKYLLLIDKKTKETEAI